MLGRLDTFLAGGVVRSKAGTFVVVSFLAIYFSSGFAALLYQVIWQRMLAIFSGADLFAITTIVASFMAGLGVGSVCAGTLADRVSFRWQIGLFAAAEAFTGLLGWASTWWYYDVLYKQYGHLSSSPVFVAVVLFGSLLLPTFLMGMTLPLLSKALTPAVELAGRRIGSLYALNTLGAASGALATAWILMGRLSFEQILEIGVAINFAVALLAVVLGFVLSRLGSVTSHRESSAAAAVAVPSTFSFSTWAVIYGLSGFTALSLEIVWFRILGVMLKSNSFTFPHLLGVYLASLAIGIFVGSHIVRFVKRSAGIFLALQSGVMIYAGVSIVGLIWGLENLSKLDWLRGYLSGYNSLDVTAARRGIESWISLAGPHPNFVSLYILVPLALIAPPTLMMGLSFPFLQTAVQDSRAFLGRRVGWLQGANILGSTLGSMLVGGLFLEIFGTSWTLRFLIAASGVFLVLSVRQLLQFTIKGQRLGYIVSFVIVIALIGAIPSGTDLWAKLHGSMEEHVIVTESGSGLSVLKNQNPAFSEITWVYTNGLGQSWIPYHSVSVIHSRLGVLPVLIHPDPKEIAVIGLGSGDTAFSLGGRPETQEITCIEIVESQLDGLRLLHAKQPYGGLESLLTDKRIKYVFGDGRRYLAASQKKYDIIEADALRATSAFAGNLYSFEYFQLLRSRLKPGGLALTWAPTHRTLETFMRVFPYVLNFDSVVVGSDQPIAFDPATIRARLDHPFTQAYYAKAGLDLREVVFPFFDKKFEELRANRGQLGLPDWNTDLFPRDEYPR